MGGLSVGLSLSQDTYSCPDGWIVSDVGGVVDCILLGGANEMVTKQDAEIICSFHDAWLVDLDEGHGGQKNKFIANLINEEQIDWADGEPNDWHRQNCLTYLTFFDPFGYHATHWNDWDCQQTARYICEKAAA